MRRPRSFSLRSAAFGLTCLLAAAPAAAQLGTTPVQAPPALLESFQLSAGTVQELALPAAAGQSLQVRIVVQGSAYTLDLQLNDLRSESYQLLVDDGTELREVPRPAPVTYRGTVLGAEAGVVAAALINGQLVATMELNGETWGVQPATDGMPGLPHALHVVYRAADSTSTGECGTENGSGLAHVESNVLAASTRKEAEIALDLDNAFFNRYGSVSAAEGRANQIMNSVQVIYQRDVNVQFKITTIITRQSPVYSTNNIQTRLTQFQNRWNSQHGSVQRDLAHLFSGIGSGGVIGVAYLGVVCNRSFAYGASATGFSGNLTSQTALVAHEVGHNFNANHCSGGGCRIMCSSLGGCSGIITSFGTTSINAICNFANSRSCLTNVSQNKPTLTGINPFSIASYPGGQVTLTGTELASVTGVMVGSTALSPSSQTQTSLTFSVPAPFTIGTHAVTVENSAGTSNAVILQVVGVHPALLVSPAIHPRGFQLFYNTFTDANWSATYFISTSNTPSSIPGFVNFGIGNNFTSLFALTTLTATSAGEVQLAILMPPTTPSGTVLHWQVLVLPPPPQTPTLPLETSNANSTTIF